MSESNNDLGGTTPIPTYVVVLVCLGMFGAGGGVNSLLKPSVETAALEQCSNNAQIALDVAADHSKEFVALNERITILKQHFDEELLRRDSLRAQEKQRQREIDEHQDRRQGVHERRINRLEGDPVRR